MTSSFPSISKSPQIRPRLVTDCSSPHRVATSGFCPCDPLCSNTFRLDWFSVKSVMGIVENILKVVRLDNFEYSRFDRRQLVIEDKFGDSLLDSFSAILDWVRFLSCLCLSAIHESLFLILTVQGHTDPATSAVATIFQDSHSWKCSCPCHADIADSDCSPTFFSRR